MKTTRILALLGALIAASAVAFLALRASPWVGEVPWIPRWISDWADRNGNLRNLPAFAALAFALIPTLGWRLGSGVAAALAISLELAQHFIAGRTFDWADIGWSLAGVALAIGVVLSWRRLRKSAASTS